MEGRNQQLTEFVRSVLFEQLLCITFQHQIYPMFLITGIKFLTLLMHFINERNLNLDNIFIFV
jgi:hypothetical protein